MTDREGLFQEIKSTLEKAAHLPQDLKENLECEWLPGDASNRFYARLKNKKSQKTFVAMVMNAPEGFKSEEASGKEQKLTELPFVTIGRELENSKIRVPHIYYVDPRSQFLVTEDLGSELLYDRRQKENAHEWYKRALEELAKFQKIKAFEPAAGRSFTVDLLEWEAEHFVEYAILKNDKKISEAALREIRNFLKNAVAEISKASYVLSHRDYHSKNLMILENEKRIGMIDFQDALMGPADYDLASLLRDSYVTLSDDEEAELIRFYESASGRKVDMRLFGFVSLQRNLKAIGRFYYILKVKGKDTHIQYVKPSVARVSRTLKQMKEVRMLSLIEGLFAS